MKRLVLLLAAMPLILWNCEKDDPPPDDEEFPVEMTCIINSIDFATNNVIAVTGSNVIQVTGEAGDTRVVLQIEIDGTPGTYSLDGTSNYSAFIEDILNNTTYLSDDGFLIIDEKDDVEMQMSGSFQFHGTEFLGYGEVDVIAGTFSSEY